MAPDQLFLRVPEASALKNRLHLDLRPCDQVAEVARLLGIGARRVSDGQPEDVSRVVLADPEGSELRVPRRLPPADR